MKYINQLSYPHIPYITRTSMEAEQREKGQKTTIKTSGCGLCSSIMAADRLIPNCEFGLEDAIALSYESGANCLPGTYWKIYVPAFAEKLGLDYEYTNDPEVLLQCLRTGGAAMCITNGDREDYVGVFTHGKHYITLIGQEPDGRIAILDPSYKEGKYEEEGRHGKVEMKNDVIALCDMQVLMEETEGREFRFFLFRRK